MAQKRTLKNGKVTWVGRYRDAAGKERSKSFRLERDAKAWEADQRNAIRKGTWIDPDTAKLTVHDIMDRWSQRPVREGTARSYDLALRNLGELGDIPAISLTQAHVETWYKQLLTGRPWMPAGDTGLAERTAREHVVKLASAMKWAVDSQMTPRSPVKVPALSSATERVRRSDLPTVEEVRDIVGLLEAGGAVYEQLRKRGKDKRWRRTSVMASANPAVADMVRTAVGTGARLSEICGLIVGDVDFLRREVRVEMQIDVAGQKRVPLKTGSSERPVPVADDLLTVLDRWCAGKGPGDWVFTNRAGNAFRAATAGGSLRQVVRHLGMEHTFHSFRHFYASMLIDRGVSVAGVQAVLGHSTSSTTLDRF